MPTITIPDTEDLQLGRFGKMQVEWAKMPQHVLDHIWKVHSAQFFTDAGNSGGRDSTNSERLALAQKKLAACYAGELRQRRDGAIGDPFEVMCYKIAYNRLVAGLTAAGFYRDLAKGTKDRNQAAADAYNRAKGAKPRPWADMVEAFQAKHKASIEDAAKAELAAREAATADLDF